jgi:hypothetical protein
MSEIASAMVHALYRDLVKGMAPDQLESVALTELG